MRGGGVEPPPCKPGPAPQTGASTNSAILAYFNASEADIGSRTRRLIRADPPDVNAFFIFLQKKPFVVYRDANSGACEPPSLGNGLTCAHCRAGALARYV